MELTIIRRNSRGRGVFMNDETAWHLAWWTSWADLASSHCGSPHTHLQVLPHYQHALAFLLTCLQESIAKWPSSLTKQQLHSIDVVQKGHCKIGPAWCPGTFNVNLPAHCLMHYLMAGRYHFLQGILKLKQAGLCIFSCLKAILFDDLMMLVIRPFFLFWPCCGHYWTCFASSLHFVYVCMYVYIMCEIIIVIIKILVFLTHYFLEYIYILRYSAGIQIAKGHHHPVGGTKIYSKGAIWRIQIEALHVERSLIQMSSFWNKF